VLGCALAWIRQHRNLPAQADLASFNATPALPVTPIIGTAVTELEPMVAIMPTATVLSSTPTANATVRVSPLPPQLQPHSALKRKRSESTVKLEPSQDLDPDHQHHQSCFFPVKRLCFEEQQPNVKQEQPQPLALAQQLVLEEGLAQFKFQPANAFPYTVSNLPFQSPFQLQQQQQLLPQEQQVQVKQELPLDMHNINADFEFGVFSDSQPSLSFELDGDFNFQLQPDTFEFAIPGSSDGELGSLGASSPTLGLDLAVLDGNFAFDTFSDSDPNSLFNLDSYSSSNFDVSDPAALNLSP